MPREQINTPARRIITEATPTNGFEPGQWGSHFADRMEPLGDGQYVEDSPVLMVGWNRPEDSGLPTQGSLRFDMHVSTTEIMRVAEMIQRMKEDGTVAIPAEWEFSTTTINRVEANKAIRIIRRARDAAFEADE